MVQSTGGEEHLSATIPASRQAWKLLKEMYWKDKRKRRNRDTRKAYQKLRRDAFGFQETDWRDILKDMNENTATLGKWLENAIRIELPPSSLELLLWSIDDYILDIGKRYHCTVSPEKISTASGFLQTFLLSGSAVAISKTVADILYVAPETRVTIVGKGPSLPNPLVSTEIRVVNYHEYKREGPFRLSITRDRSIRENMKKYPIEVIEKPKLWTPNSFLYYVEKITYSDSPSHLRRVLGIGEQHATKVGSDSLLEVFLDPACEHAITRAACHEAMEYFYRNGTIEHAKRIFVLMEMYHIRLVAKTFNIMLQGAAKSEDLYVFQFILHLMLKRGISPNGETWIAFMRCKPDFEYKLQIYNAMNNKGLLSEVHILRTVVAELLPFEMQALFQAGPDLNAFMSYMDSRYGSTWLNDSSGNVILDALGARGLVSCCWQFLNIMDSRSVIPNQISVLTILGACYKARNIHGAIEILRSLPLDVHYKHDSKTYSILFDLAWKTQSFNLARVVWRYACLDGSTSYIMRARVARSLYTLFAPDPEGFVSRRWRKFAGAVILGDLPLGEEKDNDNIIRNYLDATVRPLETPTGSSSTSNLSSTSEDKPVAEEIPSLSRSTVDSPMEKSKDANEPSKKSEHPRPYKRNPEQRDTNKLEFQNKVQPRAELEYELFLRYKPLIPFEDMLTVAAKLDCEWRASDAYHQKDLAWMLKNAVHVGVRKKLAAVTDAEKSGVIDRLNTIWK